MFVSELMKSDVIAVEPGNTLADAVRMMISRHVSGLPVVEDGKLVGIVTQGDLLRRAEIGTGEKKSSWFKAFFRPGSLANEYVHTHGRYVRDVMTASPISVTPDSSLADVADIMCERHVKRLPVLKDGKLAGIISRTDLLTVLARRLIDIAPPLTDSKIAEQIRATLAAEEWAPKSGITVKITDGVVDLEGVIISDAEGRAIRVIAETTPGVKDVRDHLVFVDPQSGMTIPLF
jgi:CBS domain-containing protein